MHVVTCADFGPRPGNRRAAARAAALQTLSLAPGDPLTPRPADQKSAEQLIHTELKREFSPEFINRIDEVIIFNPLTETELRAICQLLIDDVNHALVHKNVQITVDDSVVRWLLAKAGEETNSGARPLRRAIQRYIEDELSEFMIPNKDHVPEFIDFTMNGDDVLLVPRPVEEPIVG